MAVKYTEEQFFYDHPEIANFSGFMTVIDEKPIGFVPWNPAPVAGISGNRS